jgi:DNA modification methylase
MIMRLLKRTLNKIGVQEIDQMQNITMRELVYSHTVDYEKSYETKNKRSVWSIPVASYSEAHFATYPPELIKPCILAGCPEGGTVLDPFGGSGTTAQVANNLNRNAILCELNPEYVEIAKGRLHESLGMFMDLTVDTPITKEKPNG